MMQKPRKAKGARSGRDLTLTRMVAEPSRRRSGDQFSYEPPPELQLIYDTSPVGLAFLSPDCRYIQINQRLTEICGISVADHIGRSVRETVPQVAEQVESIVQAIIRSGMPVTNIEVRGQRPDKLNANHVWITNWHPLKRPDGSIVGVNVVAEDITERRRAEAVLTAREKALRESEVRFQELADNMSQFAWMPIRLVGFIGIISGGMIILGPPLRRCRAGGGRRCITQNMSTGSFGEFD